MKDIIVAIALALVALGCLIGMEPARERYYDCSLAEFHPDYPKEIREQCRALRQPPKHSTGTSV
jgi:hypothetical protein